MYKNFDDGKDKVCLIRPTTSSSLSRITKTTNDLRCLLILTFHHDLKNGLLCSSRKLKAANNYL